MLTGGVGLVAGNVLSKAGTFIGEELIEFAVDQLGNKFEGEVTSNEGQMAQAKGRLDGETKIVAALVKGMHDELGPELNIQWPEYGEYLFTATDAQLAGFRLPAIFPRIDEDKIRTGVVAAVVTALKSPVREQEESWRSADRGLLGSKHPTAGRRRTSSTTIRPRTSSCGSSPATR